MELEARRSFGAVGDLLSYGLLNGGLLPPLTDDYVVGLVALEGLGTGSAWGRLIKRAPARP